MPSFLKLQTGGYLLLQTGGRLQLAGGEVEPEAPAETPDVMTAGNSEALIPVEFLGTTPRHVTVELSARVGAEFTVSANLAIVPRPPLRARMRIKAPAMRAVLAQEHRLSGRLTVRVQKRAKLRVIARPDDHEVILALGLI